MDTNLKGHVKIQMTTSQRTIIASKKEQTKLKTDERTFTFNPIFKTYLFAIILEQSTSVNDLLKSCTRIFIQSNKV